MAKITTENKYIDSNLHPQQSINLLLVPSLRNVKRAGDDQSGSIKGQLNAESFYH